MRGLCFALLSLLVATACSSGMPTSPTTPMAPPAPAALNPASPADSLISPQNAGATRERETFEVPLNITPPSPCLGGNFLITGMISGWFQRVVTPNGHIHVTEHVDFSRLTGTFGEHVWRAAPGSHEIFSRSLPPVGDSAPRVIVHEGRTRFVSETGGPNVRFVHRIHRVFWLPSGESRIDAVTFEAQCYGPDL